MALSRLAILSALVCSSAAFSSYQSIIDLTKTQVNATLAQVTDLTQYPSNGVSGKYGWLTAKYNGWTSGFFPGQLWQLYNLTSQTDPSSPEAQYWMEQAVTRTSALAPESFDTGTHDVGFVIFTSFGIQYRLTGNKTARDIALQAAASLSTRYSPIVRCTQSWGVHPPPNHQFEVIADNQMNLELLFWAWQETQNQTFFDIANNHTQRMMQDLFQPFNPGCVWHLVTYNDTDGTIISRSSTPQGLGLNTVWSRGQSWSVNGFAIAYRYTQNAAYLQQAALAADCFIRLTTLCCGNSQYKWAPFWDFNVTAPSISVDTSAAMIAVSGMIEIAQHVTDPNARAKYLSFAKTVLDSLTTNYVFTPAENDAVLANGTVTYPEAGISIIYADYYLLQAIMRWDATPAEWRDEAMAMLKEKGVNAMFLGE